MSRHKIFTITEGGWDLFRLAGLSKDTLDSLKRIIDLEFIGKASYLDKLKETIGTEQTEHDQDLFLKFAFQKEITNKELQKLQEARSKYYSSFISYSHKDKEFAEKLYNDLMQCDIKCWFDRKTMKSGDDISAKVGEAIVSFDKILVIISQHSLESLWVFKEITLAENKARESVVPVLLPIKIDNHIEEVDNVMTSMFKPQIHIGNFCDWEDPKNYQKSLDQLLKSLER